MSENLDSDEAQALRREASEWLARMQRPDADKYQARFADWLALDTRHRTAYNRVLERFNDARILRQSAAFPPMEPHSSLTRSLLMPMALAVIIAAIIAWLLYPDRLQPDAAQNETQTASAAGTPAPLVSRELVTPVGQIRSIRLADGSTVTLDTNSLVQIALTAGSRDLFLKRGRARFSVAHEARPFVVHAGGGTVTAHGTLFDVAIDANHIVNVKLLSGAIDVVQQAGRKNALPVVQRLKAGQRLAYGPGTTSPPLLSVIVDDSGWPDGMLDFDSAALSDILEQANRYSTRPIILADPAMAGQKVSGRFRVNDPARLADNLARLLDLSVETVAKGPVILHPR